MVAEALRGCIYSVHEAQNEKLVQTDGLIVCHSGTDMLYSKKKGDIAMCYILYGAMDRSVNIRDYDRASQRHTYRFPLGTRHDVKMCILNNGDAFRVTDWICDCDFPVGKGDEHAPD